MGSIKWKTFNPNGSKRVIVTKELPGSLWLERLIQADCKIEVCTATDVLSVDDIKTAIDKQCDAALGQLTEDWGDELFGALKAAGGKAYSNYAVGYNNIDLAAATGYSIPVGNTPGVLTEATAEMCACLAFAAARRVVEADKFLRSGKFNGWLPTLFLGELLHRKTLGIIGMGRIGFAFAKMMAMACHMNVAYYDPRCKLPVQDFFKALSDFFVSQEEAPLTCTCCGSLKELCETADLISINSLLKEETHHLIDARAFSWMKDKAIFINAARGPVVDETALVEHAKTHPDFKVGLDVFEDEPALNPGLADLNNVVLVPHIASATTYSREGMATLAASNIAAILMGYPAWNREDILPFLEKDAPKAAPSIVNAEALNISLFED